MTWWLPTKMVRAEKGQGLPCVPLGHKKGRGEGIQVSRSDLFPSSSISLWEGPGS